MAERIFCDQCEKDITMLSERYNLYIHKVKSDMTILDVDLCPSCYAKLRKKVDL